MVYTVTETTHAVVKTQLQRAYAQMYTRCTHNDNHNTPTNAYNV